jgi:hypothetical protein
MGISPLHQPTASALNPGGVAIEVFNAIRAAGRTQFFKDLPFSRSLSFIGVHPRHLRMRFLSC